MLSNWHVNGTQSCGVVRNDASDYYLPNTAIPIMTSSTSPSGIVSASSQVVGFEGWRAFDRNTTTVWQTAGGVTSATLTYQFPSTRVIKRYMWKASSTATTPRNFTFEASNDGSSWTTLDTQTAINVGTNGIFTSSLLANTTAYLYYRLSITTNNGATAIVVTEFEMTESTSTSVGQIIGGTFNLTNGSILTTTTTNGVIVGSTTAPVTFGLTGGNSATINATITSITAVANYAAVQLNGLGTLNFTGDISCGPTSTINMRVINITAAGTLNYNGVCTNGGNTTNQCNSIFSSTAATINIITTGFSGGNTLTHANSSVFMNNGGTLFITSSGNISNGTSPAVTIIGGVSLTIVFYQVLCD